MTSFYYFCAAGDVIDTDTQWYQVTIGTTIQAQRDLNFLHDYARVNNCYFEPRSLESSQFIEKVAQSLFPNDELIPTLSLNMAKVSARQLVRSLKNCQHCASDVLTSHNRHHAMFNLSLNYRVFANIRRREKRNANA